MGAERHYESESRPTRRLVPDAEVPTLAADIRRYEPAAALCGARLAILRRLVKAAPGSAHAGGMLALKGSSVAGDIARGSAPTASPTCSWRRHKAASST